MTNSSKYPDNWKVTTLEKVASFITKGATPTTYGFDWVTKEIGIPFLRSECVTNNGFKAKGLNYISNEAHKTMARSQIVSGDLLMTITGNIGRVAVLPNSIPEANINQHIAKISVKPEFNSQFVLQVLKQESYANYYARILTGQAYPQISLKQVRETPIAIPPKKEINEIAEILSTIDEKIGLIDQKTAKTEQVKAGLMQKMFLSDGGNLAQLGELLSEKPTYGANASACEYNEGDVRYIRITDINERGNLLSKKVSLALSDYDDYLLCEDDIIIARSGNTVGKSYLYKSVDGYCAYAGYLIRFRVDKNKVLPCYLRQFLSTKQYWNWIKNNIKVGAQPNVNAQQYQTLNIPICNIEKQQEIIEILSTLDEKIELLEMQKAETKKLKKGLMQKLLTGEWRVPLDDSEAA